MNTLNLGIRAHDMEAATLQELCDQVHYYQLTNIQLAMKKSFPSYVPSLRSLSPGIASYFGDYLSRNGIKISILGCYVNISSLDLSVRKEALDAFKIHIQLAHEFRASLVGTETGSVSIGYTPDNFKEEAYVIARNSIIELVQFAENFGVTVGIEPGINHPLYTARLAKRLVEEVQSPHLKIILDGANLIEPNRFQDSDFIIQEALELLHEHIAAIHLKDFTIENGKIKIVPVGTGLINFDPLLKYLKYDRPFMHATLEETRGNDIIPAINYLSEKYGNL